MNEVISKPGNRLFRQSEQCWVERFESRLVRMVHFKLEWFGEGIGDAAVSIYLATIKREEENVIHKHRLLPAIKLSFQIS